jgi:hypothetical protein
MWVFTFDAPGEPPVIADSRHETQADAERIMAGLTESAPTCNPRNLREEPEDYIPIEERNATPHLFPNGETRHSQLPQG